MEETLSSSNLEETLSSLILGGSCGFGAVGGFGSGVDVGRFGVAGKERRNNHH